MKIFDLHCDTIFECETGKKELYKNDLQVDLQKMKKGEAFAQCFAIFLDQKSCEEMHVSPYERYRQLYGYLLKELAKNSSLISQARNGKEILENEVEGKISAIVTVEGGEVLEGNLGRLDDLYQDGVRLLTLTWNYENEIGYPHEVGGGLKNFGFETVLRMNELGMVVDVSHLSDEGFWDVIRTTNKPIVASHSCARSICDNSRNLTDEMMRAIGEQGGVIGLNYFCEFLNKIERNSTCEMVMEHAKQIVRCAGIESLALGSDFDGIEGSLEWKDYAGIQMVIDYLHREFTYDQLEKICFKNAMRIFA